MLFQPIKTSESCRQKLQNMCLFGGFSRNVLQTVARLKDLASFISFLLFVGHSLSPEETSSERRIISEENPLLISQRCPSWVKAVSANFSLLFISLLMKESPEVQTSWGYNLKAAEIIHMQSKQGNVYSGHQRNAAAVWVFINQLP